MVEIFGPEELAQLAARPATARQKVNRAVGMRIGFARFLGSSFELCSNANATFVMVEMRPKS